VRQQQRAPFLHFTRCAEARRRDRRQHEVSALLEKPCFKRVGSSYVTDRTQRTRTRPRHRELHEAGGAAALEDTRPTRYCSPPLANTPPSTPRWHTASSNQPRHTHAHTITAWCICALSVRASPRSLTQLSDRQTTDRHTARLRPWLVPLLSSRSRVISCPAGDSTATGTLRGRSWLHATIGSRPWPALGVALIKRTIVPIFSRRRRAYAEPFRSARPAATGACGRRAPRGHHHTCSGCAVGW
jgi:hypothetical protein